MNNKNQKGIKKKLLSLFIFVILAIGIFCISYIMDTKRFYKNHYKYDDKYVLKVTYAISDEEKSKDIESLEDVFNGKNGNISLFTTNSAIPLTKKGKYLYANLKDYANSIMFKKQVAYAFAEYNHNGMVLDDCEYNEKTTEIKIPISYYENKKQDIPVQFELASAASYEEIIDLDTKINIKNIYTTTKSIKTDVYDGNTLLTLKNISRIKDKKNVEIYINNNKTKLPVEDFILNPNSSTVAIGISPININKIDIRINNNNFLTSLLGSTIHIEWGGTDIYPNVDEEMDPTSDSMDSFDLGTDVPLLTDSVASGYDHYTVTLTHASAPNGSGFLYCSGDDYTMCSSSTKGISVGSKTGTIYDNDHQFVNTGTAEYKYTFLGANMHYYNPFYGNGSSFGTDLLFPYAIPINVLDNSDLNLKFSANGHYDYIALPCVHISSGSSTAPLVLSVNTSKLGDDYAVLHLKNEAGTTVPYSQAVDAYIRITWTNQQKGKIEVQKSVVPSTDSKAGFKFTLYDSTCTTVKGTEKTTVEDGKVSWDELPYATYCVKETYSKGYTPEVDHKNVTLSASSAEVGGVKTEIVHYSNRKKYYWCRVSKKDTKDNLFVGGATFDLYDTTLSTTNKIATGTTGNVAVKNGENASLVDTASCTLTGNEQRGSVTFVMITDSGHEYKVKETNPDGFTGTVDGGATHKYWNANKNFYPSDHGLQCKEMGYSNGKYTCSGTSVNAVSNPRQYYCFKVKKVDADTGQVITAPTTFIARKGNGTPIEKTTENGIATFLVGENSGTYTVTEKVGGEPAGYSHWDGSINVNAVLMTSGATETDASKCVVDANNISTVSDSKLFLNWYKVVDDTSALLNGAEFTIKNSAGKYVNVDTTLVNVRDANGVTKKCYKYTGVSNTASNLTSMNTSTTSTASNGETCISGIPEGSYTITETKPSRYYTFDSTTSRTLTTNKNFVAKVETSSRPSEINTFRNCSTEFKFTKKVTNDFSNDTSNPEYQKTTAELKQLRFNITYNGTILKFKRTSTGYEYASGIPDYTRSNDTVTDLQLNDNRQFSITKLPYGFRYKVKEVENTNCVDINQNECQSLGFYYAGESAEWEITPTSSSCANNGHETTANITNVVTELNFTKKDIYSYYDGETKSEVESKFESDEEVQLFDTIDFVLKDKNGNRLKLEKVSESATCTSSGGGTSEYRLVGANSANATEIIHTKCGSIKIKHLCRDSEYTIEEISVPNSSVFILPDPHPEVKFTVGKNSDELTRDSKTHIIDNTPTRVVFQKRDLKYGNIVSETVGSEQTTFRLYRCNKGVALNDCNTSNATLIKLTQREAIRDRQDNEDYGKQVYRYPESQEDSNLVSDLHPYKGDLIIRYLPGGEADKNNNYTEYNYILVETKAPKGYDTPTGGNEITRFKINTTTVGVDVVNIANKPSKLILRKYDKATGELLTGAKFSIYEINNYDENRSLENQEKTLLSLKTIRDGEYEYRPEYDTKVITTCIKDCNKISEDLVNAEFSTSDIAQNEKTIEIKTGEAIIQYLEAGKYYLVEEVSPKEGYELPSGDEKYVLVYMPEKAGETDASVELYNTETVYQFYKFDEYNTLLDGAEFKLQKLNKDKKYEDVKVSLDTVRDSKTEKAKVYVYDDKSTNTIITTKNGSAMIYRLPEGQYRIIEIKAPEGKELPKKTLNVATFFIDKKGNVYGSSIITNKPKTDTTTYNPNAYAELVVNIQTGQTVVKYGIIITVLILLVSGLIYVQRKRK